MNAHGLVDSTPAYDAVEPGSALSQDMNFSFFLSFLFFNLMTWMRVFSQINKFQQKTKNKNKNKQTKKGGAPLLGLAKSIYYL